MVIVTLKDSIDSILANKYIASDLKCLFSSVGTVLADGIKAA